VPGDRLDGWKAIGGHFGRDRTTAMRWAKSRGLPVRRMPGGKTATVYALKSELDQWAQSHDDALASDDAVAIRRDGFRAGGLLIGLAVAAVVAVTALAGITVWNGRSGQGDVALRAVDGPAEIPADPELAALYLQARDDWARRTPQELSRAIAGLETVTLRDPGFAPAFSALADAYLLAGEFGTLPDETAFPKAKAAARASLALNPDLAAGHRALGFVAYWWDADPAAAGRSFRRALTLSPNSAQTHFWYGNVLSDNGHHQEALAELSRARLLEPGSVPIQTDLAWARWQAGDQAAAVAALNAVIAAHPDYSAAYDCLADARLSVGDYPGYVAAYSEYARLKQDVRLIGVARAQKTALESGGIATLQALMLSDALSRAGRDIGRNHSRAAFIASVSGDRSALINALTKAEAADETWGASGTTRRIRDRWAEDAEVVRLLDRTRPASVI